MLRIENGRRLVQVEVIPHGATLTELVDRIKRLTVDRDTGVSCSLEGGTAFLPGDAGTAARTRSPQARTVMSRGASKAGVFDDDHVLFDAACQHGLEGIVATRRGRALPPCPPWLGEVRNPTYWRREAELGPATRRLSGAVAGGR